METSPPDVTRQVSDQPDVEEAEKVEDEATGCCLWLPSTSVLPSSLTTTPVYDEYGNKALGMNIVSAALILFDYGSDISVAFWLRKEKDSDFFMACTVLLIVLPLIVVNLFSLVWYSQVQDISTYIIIHHLVHHIEVFHERPNAEAITTILHRTILSTRLGLSLGGVTWPHGLGESFYLPTSLDLDLWSAHSSTSLLAAQ